MSSGHLCRGNQLPHSWSLRRSGLSEQGHVWMPMDVYICVWVHGNTCGCVWTRGYMWMCVDVYICVWILADMCGCMWIHVDVCWCVWMHVDTCRYMYVGGHGCLWMHVVTCRCGECVWICLDM